MSGSLTRTQTTSDEILDNKYHFRWASIRNLLYMTFAYSSHPYHFDLFYDSAPYETSIFSFVPVALFVGMAYMYVDLFMKEYTRRVDPDQNLSPVLKGITVSLMLQSTLYSIMLIRHVGDGVRFLATSLSKKPEWTQCMERMNESECLDYQAVIEHCNKEYVLYNKTSAHINYIIHFRYYDRGLLTWRIFVTAIVWILNFCVATIPDSIEAILKFNKYILYCKVGSSLLTYAFLAFITGLPEEAFSQLMDFNMNGLTGRVLGQVALIYGIGMIRVYDFGTTSPFTMVDNFVLIFTICFIMYAILRSMIVKILLMIATQCLKLDTANWHYLLFSILPFASENVWGQNLINLYLYLHLTLTLIPYLMLYTFTMSRLLHSEFPSVKMIYIVGLLCIAGFCISTPFLMSDDDLHEVKSGLKTGLYASMYFLGGFRMAIIMWIYGVRKFCTDIEFWLGYSPTKYWIVCWSMLPLILLVAFAITVFNSVDFINDKTQTIYALGWIIISIVVMLGIQIRIIVRYVMKNTLFGAFRANKKYGPLDPIVRKRRRMYNEDIDHRQCFHECMSFDEQVDCNHLPLMNTGEGPSSDMDSEATLMKMYESGATKQPSDVTVVEKKSDSKLKLS